MRGIRSPTARRAVTAGLSWMLDQSTMAFPASAGTYCRPMSESDRAALYVTGIFYHNPTRDVTRLSGLAAVQGTASDNESAWGRYVRSSPRRVGGDDFNLVAGPVRTAAEVLA